MIFICHGFICYRPNNDGTLLLHRLVVSLTHTLTFLSPLFLCYFYPFCSFPFPFQSLVLGVFSTLTLFFSNVSFFSAQVFLTHNSEVHENCTINWNSLLFSCELCVFQENIKLKCISHLNKPEPSLTGEIYFWYLLPPAGKLLISKSNKKVI